MYTVPGLKDVFNLFIIQTKTILQSMRLSNEYFHDKFVPCCLLSRQDNIMPLKT